ncbi:Cytochrome P450 [Dillenia turbinata]|uniref:Cytochrome P450 n=1 Tax=Dillenia turbinata TaxID=194707 RepID=A0AAN8VU58_9MAGN
MIKEATSKPISLSDDSAERVLPFVDHTVKKYGKKSFMWVGPIPRLNIMEPEILKEVLSKIDAFHKPLYNPLVKLVVCGLAGYEDDQWAKHRRLLNPAFHLEKLKLMLPAMELSCRQMIEKWEKMEGIEGSCELDVWPYLSSLSSDVIARTAFGSSYEEGKRIFQLLAEQTQLTIPVFESVYIPGWRILPTKTNKRLREIDREMQSLFRGIIHKREREMEVGESGIRDLLGMLLEFNLKEIVEHGNNKKAGITTQEVIEDCKIFYHAGQETTSILLLWTMVLLSQHQEWQKRARDEVFQVFGRDEPKFDGLNRLKILTMILHEVLRLYPSLAVVTRVTVKETKVGEMTLPAGVEVRLPIMLVHRDRDIWGEDAKEFNPARFSEGVAKAAKTQTPYFPFGWGPRICIGQNFALLEAKLAVAMILQHFSFKLSPSYAHAPVTVLTVQAQHGAHIILKKL